MFIQTEATPNPATLKFIPGRTVLGEGTAEFRARTEANASPLATRLFDVDGVTGVFLGSDFISVTKGPGEWQHIKPAILGAIMEHYMSGAPVVGRDGANDAVFGGAGDDVIMSQIEASNSRSSGIVSSASDTGSTVGSRIANTTMISTPMRRLLRSFSELSAPIRTRARMKMGISKAIPVANMHKVTNEK